MVKTLRSLLSTQACPSVAAELSGALGAAWTRTEVWEALTFLKNGCVDERLLCKSLLCAPSHNPVSLLPFLHLGMGDKGADTSLQ